MLAVLPPSCKAEAQFGQLPSPRAAQTVVEGTIWPFLLAFGRTPPPSVPIVDRRAKRDARCGVNCDDWTDPPLREPATLECYRRSHEIALAELDAAMAQDVVGGGVVEIE